MSKFLLTIKLFLYLYLSYLLYYLIADYSPARPAPFAIFVIDTIDLFIHEAGHFFTKIFGQFVYILGVSLFQILLPALLVFTTWRQRVAHIGLPGFWLGMNFINVSIYIRDAPYKHLRLIARGLIHDWNWLLSGNLEAAEPLADIVFTIGILVCAASIAAGMLYAIQAFHEDAAAE
jgi:hypothetical protein